MVDFFGRNWSGWAALYSRERNFAASFTRLKLRQTSVLTAGDITKLKAFSMGKCSRSRSARDLGLHISFWVRRGPQSPAPQSMHAPAMCHGTSESNHPRCATRRGIVIGFVDFYLCFLSPFRCLLEQQIGFGSGAAMTDIRGVENLDQAIGVLRTCAYVSGAVCSMGNGFMHAVNQGLCRGLDK